MNLSSVAPANETLIHHLRDQFFDYIQQALEHLFVILLAYAGLSILLYCVVFRWRYHTRLPRAKRVLVVTAHPDDECMFFGPTILDLNRSDCRVFVLCLSNGNHDKKGQLRRQELWNSCEVLQIDKEDVTMLNVTHLQDDPNVEWKVELVAQIVLKHIEMLDIELLVTFDKNGVSSHPNHCAIFYATASLCFSNLLPKGCKVLTLESVNLFRKYISLFDLPISLLMSTNWSIVSWADRSTVQKAMKQHVSQLVWFRKLYIAFSRYMMINSLHEINLADVEFEIIES